MKEFVTAQVVQGEKQLQALKDFLRSNELPADDVTLHNNLFLAYYNLNDELVGSGGLEFYGDKTLLRSLAVSQQLRGQLLGKQIVHDLLEQVKARGIREIYLLTQTAYYFFLKFGFTEVLREQVPPEIQASTEFSQVCPSSAKVMKFILS
jgi:amino-acid N-acetyltransferase